MTGVAVLQVGLGGLLILLVVVGGVVGVTGAVVWGVYGVARSLVGDDRAAYDGDRLLDHPEVAETERYGTDPPEVETVVDGRRVVARVETAPGGSDRFAVLQTAMLSVKAGTGFELAERDGTVEFVDRGPETPSLPEDVWTAAESLPEFGGFTVDDRTGVVEHRFPDPAAVGDPETLLAHADLLVRVAEVVEEYVETGTTQGETPTAGAGKTVPSDDDEAAGADVETGTEVETDRARSEADR